MSQALARVLIHIIFSTKQRTPWLTDRDVCKELYAYTGGILKAHDCVPVRINGVADHVHILCSLSRTIAICDLLEAIKTSSSKWLKTKADQLRDFHWQNGYGVFSVSESKLGEVARYIDNQEEHHRRLSFQDEFRLLCARHGIPIDERYVWD